MSVRSELVKLAEEGLTQAEAARRLGVSRQRVSLIATSDRLRFKRKAVELIRLTCPICGTARQLPRGEAERRKTEYCQRHHLDALGIREKALTRKRLMT